MRGAVWAPGRARRALAWLAVVLTACTCSGANAVVVDGTLDSVDRIVHIATFCFDKTPNYLLGRARPAGSAPAREDTSLSSVSVDYVGNASGVAHAQAWHAAVLSSSSAVEALDDLASVNCSAWLSGAELTVPLVLDGTPRGFSQEVQAAGRPRFWHVAMVQCGVPRPLEPTPVAFTVTLLNPGGYFTRQFSTPHQGTLPVAMGATVLCLAMLVVAAVVVAKRRRSKTLIGKPLGSVSVITAIQALSLMCRTIHLLVFASDGVGIWALELAANVCAHLTAMLLAFLVVALIDGWFITFAMPNDMMQSRRTLAIVVMMLVGGAILAALAWAYIGPAHPLAAFEGVSPPGLLALGGQCVALLAAILLASLREWRLRKAGVDSSVQVFFLGLVWVGCLWLALAPGAAAVVHLLLPDYTQAVVWWSVVQAGTLVALVLIGILVKPKPVAAPSKGALVPRQISDPNYASHGTIGSHAHEARRFATSHDLSPRALEEVAATNERRRRRRGGNRRRDDDDEQDRRGRRERSGSWDDDDRSRSPSGDDRRRRRSSGDLEVVPMRGDGSGPRDDIGRSAPGRDDDMYTVEEAPYSPHDQASPIEVQVEVPLDETVRPTAGAGVAASTAPALQGRAPHRNVLNSIFSSDDGSPRTSATRAPRAPPSGPPRGTPATLPSSQEPGGVPSAPRQHGRPSAPPLRATQGDVDAAAPARGNMLSKLFSSEAESPRHTPAVLGASKAQPVQQQPQQPVPAAPSAAAAASTAAAPKKSVLTSLFSSAEGDSPHHRAGPPTAAPAPAPAPEPAPAPPPVPVANSGSAPAVATAAATPGTAPNALSRLFSSVDNDSPRHHVSHPKAAAQARRAEAVPAPAPARGGAPPRAPNQRAPRAAAAAAAAHAGAPTVAASANPHPLSKLFSSHSEGTSSPTGSPGHLQQGIVFSASRDAVSPRPVPAAAAAAPSVGAAAPGVTAAVSAAAPNVPRVSPGPGGDDDLATSLTNDETLDGLFGLSSDEEDGVGARGEPSAPARTEPVARVGAQPVATAGMSGFGGAAVPRSADTRRPPARIQDVTPAGVASPPPADANIVDSLFASADDDDEHNGEMVDNRGVYANPDGAVGVGGDDADVDKLFDEMSDDDNDVDAGLVRGHDGAAYDAVGDAASMYSPPIAAGAHAGNPWAEATLASAAPDLRQDSAAGDDDDAESLF